MSSPFLFAAHARAADLMRYARPLRVGDLLLLLRLART